jgi:hypothetical protein
MNAPQSFVLYNVILIGHVHFRRETFSNAFVIDFSWLLFTSLR